MRDRIEVMRVVRIPPRGELVVVVGNKQIRKLADAPDEATSGRLLAAVGELIDFAGGYEVLVEAGVAPPLTGEGGTLSAAQEPSLTRQQEAFLQSLEAELKAAGRSAPSPPPGGNQDRFQREPSPYQGATAGSGLNIVEEIDAILQRHLAADPTLKERTIRLEQPPASELQIVVDGEYYHHPKEIEDKDVRVVIRKALEEWESR